MGKAVQLLDALQKEGKAEAGCLHLKTNLEGVTREKVQNWRAYSYSLLRAFDNDIYTKMKSKAEGNRRAAGNKKKAAGELNTTAAEFTPGVWWQGDTTKGSFAQPTSPMNMGYPMNMGFFPPMMPMSPTGGGSPPPPPPTKAAEVPKAAAEALAPTKDATVEEKTKEEKA